MGKKFYSKIGLRKFSRKQISALAIGALFALNTSCTSSGFQTGASLVSKSFSSVMNTISGSTAAYMGVNTAGLSDYSSQFFADVIKTGRPWGPTGTPCWGSPYPIPSMLDANGWPNQDAGICLITGASLFEVGTYSLSFTGQATVTTILDNNVSVKNSVYNAATNTTTADVVALAGAAQLDLIFKNTKRLPTDTVATGVTNVKLMRPGQSNQIFSQLFLDRAAAASTLRLMDVMATNGTMGSVWSQRRPPTYAIQMDWGMTYSDGTAWEYIIALANASGKDLWINIPDQATDDYVAKLAQLFKYGSDQNGNVYSSPQANPYWAPLNSRSKIYIEYSNELWNWAFSQFGHNQARGNAVAWASSTAYPAGSYVTNNGNLYFCLNAIASSATAPTGTGQDIIDGSGAWAYTTVFPTHLNFDGANNIWYNAYRFTGDRIATISNIFRAQFGDALMNTQFLPVLASQIGNSAVYHTTLDYMDAVLGLNNTYGNPQVPINHYIYGLAGAPYWGIPSLSATTWPDSCSTTMSTCTSYSSVPAYATTAYTSANGNLYTATSPITQSWKVGATYYDGNNVISGTNIYTVTSTVTTSVTAPTGTGTGIADGAGAWAFVKSVPARVTPSGTGSSITDGDGTWKYLYTYGDTASEMNQAFIDLTQQIDAYVAAPTSMLSELVATSANYGLVPLGYEGGLDTSQDDNFTTLVTGEAFQNDPRMGLAMTHFYDVWFAGGGKLINYYSLSGLGSKYGTWGMISNLSEPNTARFSAFVQESTLSYLPALTGGKAVPATLSPTDMFMGGGYLTETSRENLGGTSSAYYEINVPTTGTYVFKTNVYTHSVRIMIDNASAGDLAVGTGSTLAIPLTAGIHAVMVRGTTLVVADGFAYDPIVITKQ